VRKTVNGKRVDFALDLDSPALVTVSYYDVVSDKTYVTSLACLITWRSAESKFRKLSSMMTGTEYNQVTNSMSSTTKTSS